MMSNDITEWIDTYWRYVDDGYSYHDALASTCVRYGLSSYEGGCKVTPKSCGTCEFWDRENAVKNMDVKASDCLAPVPASCADIKKLWMFETEGNDCPIYVERQDEEVDDDQPDENGYTRADEDWFFDDKDD